MKDYKRLTERDVFGNADIIGLSTEKLYSELCFSETNLLTKALNKLVELEDKIESGELCDGKEVAREIFEELYDDVSPIFHSVTLSKDTIKDRAEAYGVILEDEE